MSTLRPLFLAAWALLAVSCVRVGPATRQELDDSQEAMEVQQITRGLMAEDPLRVVPGIHQEFDDDGQEAREVQQITRGLIAEDSLVEERVRSYATGLGHMASRDMDTSLDLSLHELHRTFAARDLMAPSLSHGAVDVTLAPNNSIIIGRELGGGQFGVVVEATDKATGEKFAMKTIPKSKVSDCKQEVSLQKRVQPNAHAVRIVSDHFDSAGNLVLMLELMKDGDLFEKIEKGKGLVSPYDPLLTFSQLVEGLKLIHEQNVVHRDLKPENIVCDESTVPPTVKIGDFGLATIFTPGEATLTDSPGSLHYASPEIWQAKTKPYIGPEVDVWSLGVVLYVFLSGVHPFQDDKQIRVADKIMHRKYKPLPNSVSSKAKDLVARMLDKSPTTRITLQQVSEHSWVTGLENGGVALRATSFLVFCIYFLCS